MNHHSLPLAVAVLAWAAAAAGAEPPPAAGDPHEAARALLLARCVECHGPDAQESNLRLDSRAGLAAGGDFGPVAAIEPPAGRAAASELVRRLTTTNADDRMPPDGPPLAPAEVAAVVAWLDAGAPWPGRELPPEGAVAPRDPRLDHWAWQPLVKPSVPAAVPAFTTLADVEPDRAAIDAFIRARLAEAGLAPSPLADRRTLIRRVSFDLTGLPPTPEEVAAFVADDDPSAYDRLVDRLLASPRYGERWARHWLDVVHYGDTHGYDKDKPRPHAWPYRDYVIRAFNDDTPYARFVAEQVAGDVLWPDTREGHEAIGFIAAGPWDFIGHREVPETKTDGKIARHLDRDDMVAATIGTFCSVTVHCAQCHAHKFDPISQDDYYALQAVFAAIDRDDHRFDADPAVAARRRALTAQLAAHERVRREIEAAVAEAAGPRLAELDAALAKAAKATSADPNPTPAYGWHSAIATDPDAVKWVQVDLGVPKPLREIVLRPCHDTFNGIGAGFGFPRRYRVEVSDDAAFREGVTVVGMGDAADGSGPGLAPQRHACERTARYVRVTATRLAARKNDFIVALAELELIGGDGVNVARGATVTALDSIEASPRWGRGNLVDGHFPTGGDDAVEAVKAERARLVARHRSPEQAAALAAADAGAAEARREIAALPEESVVYAATSLVRKGVPRAIHVLARGNVLSPTREARPGALSLLEPLAARFALPPDHAEGERRAALARWLTDPANPLTWRSIVNRVWHYHFGRGIVATPGDLGRMGAEPSHPGLLDWLAADVRDSGGSLKRLHRQIVTSATYRQTSAVRADAATVDADNALLWRQNRRRLEAEAVRDAVLAVAGTLDLTMGGPGWQDFVIEHPQHSPHYRYDLADPADRSTWRRGVYRFIVRSQTQPFMTALDCADPSMRVEQRTESLSALQALALLNNGFMVVQSREFADRVIREAGPEPATQVDRAVQLALGRAADAEERAVLVDLVRRHGLANACRAIFNLNEFSFVD